MPSIDSQITFLYTRDLQQTARFYEQIMGFHLEYDQGDCRIYRISSTASLGFCQRDSAPTPNSEVRPPLIVTLISDDVDGWYDYLKAKGVAFEKPPQNNPKYRIYHCFLRDPNGYLIEIQKFLD